MLYDLNEIMLVLLYLKTSPDGFLFYSPKLNTANSYSLIIIIIIIIIIINLFRLRDVKEIEKVLICLSDTE